MIIELERKNFNMLNWLEKYLTGHKGFVCGGCFKNIFNNEKVKDLDIFFRNEADWADAVQYFDERTVGYGFDDEKVTEDIAEYRFYYENKNVKAYKDIHTDVVIELCRSIFGEPKDILKNFDFTITKFAYYKEEVTDNEMTEETSPFINEDELEQVTQSHIETKIICDDKFFEHLHLKRLVIDDKIPFPMSTFERVLKYAKYGYFPCKESKIKLAKAIKDLSEEQIKVSESLYKGWD